ncbi:MAG: hypothetical protein VB092_08385 [Oscillospiraceae bacterium]|nr:hypothetical protein [Oscillospiraceae bacterium]
MKRKAPTSTLLRAQVVFAASLLAVFIALKLLFPQALALLRQQYADAMRAVPVWTLDEVRAIVQPIKDTFLRLFHA